MKRKLDKVCRGGGVNLLIFLLLINKSKDLLMKKHLLTIAVIPAVSSMATQAEVTAGEVTIDRSVATQSITESGFVIGADEKKSLVRTSSSKSF